MARLRINNLNMQTGELLIVPFSTQKKTKSMTVFISKSTRHAIWIYLHKERKDAAADDSLFGCASDTILQLCKRAQKKTGIVPCNVHRFRHTFAIEYLRNGGNVFELQRLLGHTTLDMVKRYVQIAQSDLSNSHKKASPVENWKL